MLLSTLALSSLLPLAEGAALPRKAPELAVSLQGGKQMLLSSTRGKAVAMIFILTYCPHCQKTITMLSKMQQEYGPRGFAVVASAIEDTAAVALPNFIKQFNPPFPVGYNTRDSALDFLQHPMMERLLMPQLVFIDKQGMIQSKYGGDDKFFGDDVQEKNIRREIEAMLGGAPAGAKKGGVKKAAAPKQ
jgi:thiol-disulfide isomerase/thioredoxin